MTAHNKKNYTPVFKKSLMALAIMGICATATGQEVEATDEDAELEVIQVSGTRANLLNAQNLKRNAETVVDSITAADIGSLPDRSVLEAIQRLPGVSIERFSGPDDPDHFSVEGSGAIIRGMTQTRSEFNGRDSFTANSGRGLSFQDVSPELMGGVDVYKSQTADMIEGGIGGTISLRTRKPFDAQGRVFAFNADYSYGDIAEEGSPTFSVLYSDRWELDSGAEFGLLINYAKSTLNGASEGIQSDAYVQYNASELAGAEDFVGDGSGKVWMPNGANLLQKTDHREREGFSTAMQFESADDTVLASFQYIRSDATLSWHEQAIKYQGGYKQNLAGENASRPLEGTQFAFDDMGRFESGTITQGAGGWRVADGNVDHVPRAWGDNAANQWGHINQFESRVKDTSNLVEDYSFNVRWLATDNLTLTGDVQYIKADTQDDDVLISTATFIAQEYDLTGGSPTVAFLEPWLGARDADPDAFATGYPGFSDDPAGDSNYFNDPNSYFLRSAMDHYERSEGDSIAARLDGKYFLEDAGILSSVEMGVRYAKREQTIRKTGWNWGALGPEFSGAAPASWLATTPEISADSYESVDWSDFMGGDAANIPGNKTIHLTEDYVRSVIAGARPYQSAAGDWVPYPDYDDVDAEFGLFSPSDVSNTIETNKALYVKLNFESDDDIRYSGNIGLRYVELKRDASGFVSFPDLVPGEGLAPPASIGDVQLTPEIVTNFIIQQITADPSLTVANVIEANAWISEQNNYLPDASRAFGNNYREALAAEKTFKMFLPSFNLKLELSDELIARFALSKAVALPDIGDITNYSSLGASDITTVRAGGPIDPENPPEPEDNLLLETYVGSWTGSGGNPLLEPMESVQYDIGLEWYFADVGQLSATLFHKDLSNYFIQGGFPRSFTNPSNGEVQTVLVSTTTNGGKGTMDGLELAYQQFFDKLPAPFDGLGVQATYTYIDASGVPNNEIEYEDESWAGKPDEDPGVRITLDNVPLQGQSKHTANFVAMYEKNGWNARLAYNWRSKYLLTTRDVISKVPLWYDDHGQLDGSVFYKVSDNITVGIQGTNMTNSVSETIMQLSNEGLEAGRSWFESDRRVALVVRGNF
ncbi:TonB-dependent receptor [Paraglaciecola sp. L3A3]|uniref:TonB-dependent receptor n=1 Tax=Paraglaciecola sp. L3A3 TaxID=2686358 RepID=UPI0018EEFFB6|nr:TonB-dependent receptor [Paraglaciecola sp. L3A3]